MYVVFFIALFLREYFRLDQELEYIWKELIYEVKEEITVMKFYVDFSDRIFLYFLIYVYE